MVQLPFSQSHPCGRIPADEVCFLNVFIIKRMSGKLIMRFGAVTSSGVIWDSTKLFN